MTQTTIPGTANPAIGTETPNSKPSPTNSTATTKTSIITPWATTNMAGQATTPTT